MQLDVPSLLMGLCVFDIFCFLVQIGCILQYHGETWFGIVLG